MTASEDLVGAVCASLSNLADHVSLLKTEDFREPVAELAGATIGQHVRHCLDHYLTLANGISSGRLDYDDRARSVDVECDRECAITLSCSLLADLQPVLQSVDLDAVVHVRTASSTSGEVGWQRSSVGRELQFVVSHTAHHAAMVATSCRVRGLPVAPEHGVAPSTLRHRAAL
jgi:hypothetical protein